MLLPLLGRISGILPIIFFILFLKRNKQGRLWVIFLYCLVSIGTDNIYHHLEDRPINYFYVYSSFTIVEYSFFAFFLYSSLKEKALKYIVLICSLLFYIVAIRNFLTIKTERFDSFSASVEDVLLILCDLLPV